MMDGTRELILSIDDDPDVRELIAATLTGAGYEVITAADGPKGIALVEQEHPALVLLDVMMPGMDGYEVCSRLQRKERAAYTPVVFLTARGSSRDRQRAFACGAVDYLAKPFDRSTLLGAVTKHLATTEQWRAIVQEADSWTERIVPDDFVRFRDALASRFDIGSLERETMQTIAPTQLYDAGGAAGLGEVEIAQAVSEHLGISYMPQLDSSAVVIDSLPVAFCRKNLVVPLTDAAGLPLYVVANPFNWELLDLLERKAQSQDEPLNLAVSTPEHIVALFRYGAIEENGPPVHTVSLRDDAQDLSTASAADVEAAPVVFIANNLILTAVRERASDIHLEPKEDRLEVRLRVDGDMTDLLSLKPATGVMLLSRLKALGSLDIAEKRKPQDGSLETHIGDKRLKLRIATSSGPYGESMVIRILQVTAEPTPLTELGFTDEQASTLYGFAARPQGLVLVVGPTGSGKTTTIYSVLSTIDTEKRSLMTVEDPVEYIIPRANHQQVNDKAGVTFDNLLKSSVRQDPDVLFLGEIRDQFSARTAVDFASTGHLTVSTLHTSNATTAIFRLERLGVDRSIMADALLGVVAQRLVKRLCPECRHVEPITAEERAWLEPFTDDVPEMVAHPVGCPRCRGGYSGRTGVQEIMEFDAEVSGWIRDGVSITEIRQRLADRGDYLITNSAVDKVRALEVSPADVYERVLVEEQAVPRSAAAANVTTPRSVRPEAPVPALDGEEMLIGASAPEAPALGVRTSSDGSGGPARILVVDDDYFTRELVTRTLMAEGYEVTSSADGVEALDQLRAGSFDLILSDVTMPNMTGMEMLEALVEVASDIPVIMLTGVDDGEVEVRALKLGVADYIQKPVRKDVLLLRVGRVVRSDR